VDHVIPLKRGGADAPWNMQWQNHDPAGRGYGVLNLRDPCAVPAAVKDAAPPSAMSHGHS
jgi:hypothetical protein